MSRKVADAIRALGALDAGDFDRASISELAQLGYWCHATLAPITVKTIGRIAAAFNGSPPSPPTAPPAGKDGAAP